MKVLHVDFFSHKKMNGSILILLAVALGGVLVSCSSTPQPVQTSAVTSTPTPLSSDDLTSKYGDEVKGIIETFELAGHTVKMYKNVDYRSTVFTGPYLDYINSYYLSFDESSTWTIVSQATVTTIKVIEYSDAKIRAAACVTEQKLDLNQKGKLLKQEPPVSFKGAYVFTKTDGSWKLASFLDMTQTETAKLEYGMMDADLKTITGDFESLNSITCDAN
jgi:hypothetical protein